jgi:hypothetical protein
MERNRPPGLPLAVPLHLLVLPFAVEPSTFLRQGTDLRDDPPELLRRKSAGLNEQFR